MENFKDLRDWLKEIEKMEELKTINEEVDWDEELSAITYMVAKNHGSPALLFENIKDYPQGYRVLSNIFGSSLKRIGFTLGLPHDRPESGMTSTSSASPESKGYIQCPQRPVVLA